VEWGVQTAADTGVPATMPFRVISQGVPTQAFMAAAGNWNAQTISMPGRIVSPGAGTVASREALVAGTQYAANALVMTITTSAGPAEVRMPVAAAFDSFLVAVGATVTAGQQLAVYRTQEATADLPITGHHTVDPATLGDAELEHRMRTLCDEILHADRASPDYQNKRFEIRALGRVAVARGRDAVDSGHTYTVRSGDTLWAIAQAHLGGGTRWTRIMALNAVDLQDPNVIGVGATLKMPRPFAGGAD
jgi:nucleoid-associated protein YgaU